MTRQSKSTKKRIAVSKTSDRERNIQIQTAEVTHDAFNSPESSNVEGGAYDVLTGDTVIAFRDKKKPGAAQLFYQYSAVSKEDWDALKAAESKGRHMAVVFTKKYKGELLP